MQKTALIVDDSKTARVVLKRVLETHDLNVDTAESAEDALEYLIDNRPDVVFMDHLMPGMDGFEAVTAIKNNPATATIPIMMYTSQKGEVYVGQARALGAIGVLPKEVEPVEVSKVLESLRVIGDDAGRRAASQDADAADLVPAQPDLEQFDINLRELIQDLFDQQRAVLRRDLLDSYEAIASRVAEEIRLPDEDDEASVPVETPIQMPRALPAAVAILAVVVVVFAWLYWEREQSWQEVLQQNADLARALEDQQSIEAQSTVDMRRRLDNYQQSLGSTIASAVEAIEWGVNQSSGYAFDDIPFGNLRLAMFEEMSQRLLTMGFAGEIRVESHVGDFCMVTSGTDGFALASPGMAATRCDAIGFGHAEAFELGMRQSVAFANFVNRLAEQSGGGIRFDIVSLGNSAPLVPYPNSMAGVSAAAWNNAAAANNRVIVSLLPD